MAKRVLAWECVHCGRLYKECSEKTAIRHEKACLSNPNAKNCLFCHHRGAASGMAVCTKGHGKCSRAKSANCKDFERMKLQPYEQHFTP